MTTNRTPDTTEALILKYRLQPGNIYRRADLGKVSNSVDRDLAQLVASQVMKSIWRGLYECPKYCEYGLLPPDPAHLIRAFLNSDDFLIISPNDQNSLGLGTTQLYNHLIVFNRKRRGRVELAGLIDEFHTRAIFPKEATVEFLREIFRGVGNHPQISHQEDCMTTRTPRKLGLGLAKGTMKMADDFDAPMMLVPDNGEDNSEKPKESKRELFGIWDDNNAVRDVKAYIRNLRKGRKDKG